MAGKKGSENTEFLQLLQSMNSNISDVKTSISTLDKRFELHAQKTEFEFRSIRDLDEKQNSILAEHHDRSTQLKRDNDLKEAKLRQEMLDKEAVLKREMGGITARVAQLEAPRKWFKSTWKILLSMGAGAGALYGIIQFIQALPK